MLLSSISGKVDERVGIGSDTGKTSENVAFCQLRDKRVVKSLLVEKEDLFSTTTHPCFSTFSSHTFSTGC
jgi:hypothetical protein